MTTLLSQKSWSPYVVGALIGILSWFAFATVDKPIGITTACEHIAAFVEKATVPGFEQRNEYVAVKEADGGFPKNGWEWMLVIGFFFGALLSARLSGDRTRLWVPPLWDNRFGPGKTKRLTAAFFTATLIILGARLAQGCTSGHVISGTLQLAVFSWAFISLAFGIAIAMALLMYGREGASHV